MNTESNEALVVAKQVIAALTRRDPEALIALLHQDVVLEVPYPLVKGENATGSKRSAGAAVHAYVRDVKARTSKIEFANVIWRTTTDGLAIFQADGKLSFSDGRPYENHYLMMFEVSDGKITRWREYLSPIAWARAFGAPLDALP